MITSEDKLWNLGSIKPCTSKQFSFPEDEEVITVGSYLSVAIL